MTLPKQQVPPRDSVFHRHRRKTLIAILLVGLPAVDVAATTSLRACGLYTPPTRREVGIRCWHSVYHHDLRPSKTTTDLAMWGRRNYALHTNSLGFKDASARDIPLQRDGKRIVLIGDSFTEGVGVEFPLTFAGLLSRRWRDLDIEVLNAGVVTYSPAIYWKKCQYLIEKVGLRFDRLVVCLDVSDIYDDANYYEVVADRVVRRVEGFDETVKQFIHSNTIVINGLRDLVRVARSGPPGPQQVLDIPRSAWTRDEHLWESYGRRGIECADRHLDHLFKLLRTHRIAMTLVVYPWPDQILHRERECVQVTHWREWCAKRGVDFIDAFPTFLDAGPAKQVLKDYFIPGDVHWNERGHKLMAGLLEASLRK